MNNVSIGNCGEYFVAAELERRGFSVGVPMSNTKNFDVLAINNENYNQYAIQVKTTKGNKKSWLLSKKNENLVGDNIIYVFVTLNELNHPEYHIVPSKVVAERITANHQLWLNTKGRDGQDHNDNNMREFKDNDNEFLNNWELLK